MTKPDTDKAVLEAKKTDMSFGKFPSLSAFLESYKAEQKAKEFKDITLERIRRRRLEPRDVVEIQALLVERQPDDEDENGGMHYRLKIQVTQILKTDPDVDEDLQDAMNTERSIFVAIRFGDSMGIQQDIVGLEDGAELRIQGEWITRENARSHGGERMSVLHFTHHPLGHICVGETCYA